MTHFFAKDEGSIIKKAIKNRSLRRNGSLAAKACFYVFVKIIPQPYGKSVLVIDIGFEA